MPKPLSRRSFLLNSLAAAGAVGATNFLTACGDSPSRAGAALPIHCGSLANIGPLQAADDHGIQLPAGFSARIVAVSGQEVMTTDGAGTAYVWHPAPDGSATFALPDGGWVLVSNRERVPDGGAGAMRFDAKGNIVDAYEILSLTRQNCAGGKTPWNSWLSCEEQPDGRVYECDPYGVDAAVVKPALGSFSHEAVAVDPLKKVLYLTEDFPTGYFYRFVPDDWQGERPSLNSGRLQVAKLLGAANERDFVALEWLDVPEPTLPSQAQFLDSLGASQFNGGEGLWYQDGLVYFTTKGDNRVWLLDSAADKLMIVYDQATAAEGQNFLAGVDNVVIAPSGDVLIAEDGDDMQLVVLTPERKIIPLLRFDGQPASEVTGPCFSPDGRRLYVNSQRGPAGQGGINSSDGVTYEITGFDKLAAC